MIERRVASFYAATAAAGIVCLFATRASAVPSTLAWDFTGGIGGISIGGGPRTEGVQFTVTSPTTVTALGFWDNASQSLLNAHTITLWTNDGTQLATTTVDNASFSMASLSGAGQWLFTSISPLLLNGGTYVVSAGYVNNDDTVDEATGNTPMTVTPAPGMTWIGNAFSASGAGTGAFPGSDEVGQGLFGADMLVTRSDSPVPEPASLPLLAAAIGGLGALRRRR